LHGDEQLTRKQVVEQIKKYLNEGKSQEEIYETLLPICPDKRLLVKSIIMLPTKEKKEEYKNLNLILFVFLVLQTVLKMAIYLSSPDNLHSPFWIFIMPLSNLFMAVWVLKMSRPVYSLIWLFELWSVIRAFPKVTMISHTFWFWLTFSLIAIISILSFYLGNKIFPNFGMFSSFGKNKALEGYLSPDLISEFYSNPIKQNSKIFIFLTLALSFVLLVLYFRLHY